MNKNPAALAYYVFLPFLCCFLLALPLSIAAAEEEATPATPTTWFDDISDNLSGHIGVYSRYVGRGRVQSDDSPALQGSINYNHKLTDDTRLFFGVWGSNADLNDGNQAEVEFDLSAGISHTIDKLTLQAAFIRYIYPGAADSLDYDYNEIFGAIEYDFGVFSTGLHVKYSPEFFGSSGEAVYYRAHVSVPLPHDFSTDFYLGRQEVDRWNEFGFRDYNHWSVALNYDVQEDLRLSVEYKDTDISTNACPQDWCDSLVVFGITKTF